MAFGAPGAIEFTKEPRIRIEPAPCQHPGVYASGLSRQYKCVTSHGEHRSRFLRARQMPASLNRLLDARRCRQGENSQLCRPVGQARRTSQDHDLEFGHLPAQLHYYGRTVPRMRAGVPTVSYVNGHLRGHGEPGKSSATPRNKLMLQRITSIAGHPSHGRQRTVTHAGG